MALILGNDRVYGVDGEGGLYHEHPAEETTHTFIKERFDYTAKSRSRSKAII